MLIAIIGGLLLIFGGGGETAIDRIKDALGEHVEDDGKRERAEERLEQLEAEVEMATTSLEKKTEAFFSALEKKNTKPADLEKLLDSLQREREALQQKALDARFDIRKELSAEEWSRVFAPTE